MSLLFVFVKFSFSVYCQQFSIFARKLEFGGRENTNDWWGPHKRGIMWVVEKTDGWSELDFIRMDGDDTFVGATGWLSRVRPLHVSHIQNTTIWFRPQWNLDPPKRHSASLHPGFRVIFSNNYAMVSFMPLRLFHDTSVCILVTYLTSRAT